MELSRLGFRKSKRLHVTWSTPRAGLDRNVSLRGATRWQNRGALQQRAPALGDLWERFESALSSPLPEVNSYSFLILSHICPILCPMTGNEFIRKIRRLGRQRGVKVAFVSERGKGSHGTLYDGNRLTIVHNPKDALKTGTPHAMLTQLGLTLSDL